MIPFLTRPSTLALLASALLTIVQFQDVEGQVFNHQLYPSHTYYVLTDDELLSHNGASAYNFATSNFEIQQASSTENPIQMEFGYVRLQNTDSQTKGMLEQATTVTSSNAVDTSLQQRALMANGTDYDRNQTRRNVTDVELPLRNSTQYNTTLGNYTHSNATGIMPVGHNATLGTTGVHRNTTQGRFNYTYYSSTGHVWGRMGSNASNESITGMYSSTATNATISPARTTGVSAADGLKNKVAFLLINALFILAVVWMWDSARNNLKSIFVCL